MMGTASLQFIAYGLACAVLSNLHRSLAWRQFVLLAASVIFLGFFSLNPAAYLPLAGFLVFGYVCVRLLQGKYRKLFVPAVVLGIAMFVWLKKYTFIPSGLFLQHPYVTLGLSYIFFRVMHLIIDAHDADVPERISVVSYLNYTLNFTTLVSGPIQTYPDFARSQLAVPPLPLNLIVIGHAVRRIIVGFFKVNVLSLLLNMAKLDALESLTSGGPSSVRIVSGAIVAAIYPLYLYANFSGYIDIVIGLARLMRIELPENFNRPFSSPNFLIFWNRWHMTLSNWLKTYVYNPIVISCMRRWPSTKAEPAIVASAFFITFFLIGVWHGQTSEFAFYGILLGLGVSVTKLYQMYMTARLKRAGYNKLARNPLYVIVARGMTYTWYAFCMLWFWSNWSQLHTMAAALSPGEMTAAWALILVAASVALAAWESMRQWLLSFEFESRPWLESRYVRTAWCTALLVIALTTVSVLNAPAPDIVYKAF
jgi:alginate O-acetyltransferase complex protein AlgI